MSLIGFVKDIVLLPIDIAMDVTMITPVTRSMNDCEKETPFGTIDRLKSMVDELEETRKH